MDRRIQVIIALMENRVSVRLDIAELAREVNLSPSRLRHLFKRETGNTPAQHLKNLRMQKAEWLLRTTFLSVKEVINRIGMTNSSHFVREFKKIYDAAPTKYRAALAQEPTLRTQKY
jgi:AraC family transcriptional regulator of arabinose operon